MNLIQRVQDILLKPRATWPAIDAEPADAASLYKNYVMVLALIPAVAGFLGLSVVGVGPFGFGYRVPVVPGLVNMVVGYALSLAMVYVLALIVDALAPSFEGSRSPIGALKLSAYASTAGFVGGVFSLIPALSVLGALAALYGVYLIYLGLPVLMKCPPDKALGYTAVVVVCAIVGGVLIGWVLALLTPAPVPRIGALPSGFPVAALQHMVAPAA